MKVTVKIENAYSDGHESESVETHDLPPVTTEIDCWAADHLWPLTGDGHGIGKDLGSCCIITVITADEPLLVGETFEWTD